MTYKRIAALKTAADFRAHAAALSTDAPPKGVTREDIIVMEG